ncbi:hypothetical protein Cob_v010945 [Colletotrichum orbiculare MAFF 240422]|uniref:Integral membrane protein n=1 Tax=Colletotrichum orbiculare (strain 104-T / ATCC 96160 / CBS 514.97 / LARS 414 / MAFF 240422) TaxID=1213857 RepID=A0A484FGS4_COLOR|nr:hypothetical protein Cob_v010945 [Colletotrichum orbiculare MAFF 240422]
MLALSASVCVLLSSILAVAFKMVSYTTYREETGGSPTGVGTKSSPIKGSDGWIYAYPEHLVPVARAPLVVAASFGMVIGVAATCLISRSLIRKCVLPLTFAHQIALLAALAANALIATITMIYMLVQHSHSAHFDPEYEMATAYYDHGLFTLEAWACESPRYVDAFRNTQHHSLVWQCTTERAVVAKKQQRTKNNLEDDGWEY